MKALNNYVIVDIGQMGANHTEYKTKNGGILYLAPVDNIETIRASGKVVSAPEKLEWSRENQYRYDVTQSVEDGDVVFFEPNTHSYCKQHGLIIQESPSLIIAVPYHLLVCRIHNDEVFMLNGKYLIKDVKEVKEKETKSGIIIPEMAQKKNYEMEVIKASDKVKGRYLPNGKYIKYGNDMLKEGDRILVGKFSDFKIQGLVVEDERVDNKKVDYENIIAVKRGNWQAFGFYVAGKPMVKEEKTTSGIITKTESKASHIEVTSIGGNVDGVKVGDIVKFRNLNIQSIDGLMYVRKSKLTVVSDKEGLEYFEG